METSTSISDSESSGLEAGAATVHFSAKYYDGLSSRAHLVVVSADAEFLRILGLPVPVAHPLARVLIAPRLGNTPRSLRLPDGATCETEDNDAVDDLERRSGRGRAGAFLHRLESRWWTALTAAIVLLACVGGGWKWGIPLLARHVADRLPEELAYDLGRGTLQVLDRTLFKPSRLPEARKTELRAAFEKMTRSYPRLPLVLEFRHAPGPNAFALPNGTVVVTDQLVKQAGNDEQILSVLAHEIGHVHYRHGLRMALESSAAGLLIGVYFGDVAQVSGIAASLPAIYAEARYSQDHESEADSFALQYLEQNGIPKRHFAEILRTLEKASGSGQDGVLEYLSSHPPTGERIQRFEQSSGSRGSATSGPGLTSIPVPGGPAPGD